jgi:hypothetical protein
MDRIDVKRFSTGHNMNDRWGGDMMKSRIALNRLALACVLGSFAVAAMADPGTSADELLADAGHVLQQFDAGRYADAWQDVAPYARSRLTQDEFVTSTSLARHAVGAVSSRGWASITRIRYAQAAKLPDGLYANVDFATTLVGGGTMFELLSFRLELDGHWHLTGYQPRTAQGGSTAQTEVVSP